MKKKPSSSTITNRRAKFDYNLEDEIVVGLALSGRETRAARDGHVQLRGAYVQVKNNELWLQNASFSLKNNLPGQSGERTVDLSPRKILARRKQIDNLIAQKTTGKTILPTRLINQGRFIKLAIALGTGKKLYDKRETIKRRQQDRETARQIRAR